MSAALLFVILIFLVLLVMIVAHNLHAIRRNQVEAIRAQERMTLEIIQTLMRPRR